MLITILLLINGAGAPAVRRQVRVPVYLIRVSRLAKSSLGTSESRSETPKPRGELCGDRLSEPHQVNSHVVLSPDSFRIESPIVNVSYRNGICILLPSVSTPLPLFTPLQSSFSERLASHPDMMGLQEEVSI